MATHASVGPKLVGGTTAPRGLAPRQHLVPPSQAAGNGDSSTRTARVPTPRLITERVGAESMDEGDLDGLEAGGSFDDLVVRDGGPPRFSSPFFSARDASAVRADLPFMLYLPGIDGTGFAAYPQFPKLAKNFNFRTMTIPPADRTPFQSLISIVKEFLEDEAKVLDPDCPIYIFGESFGGLLALAVAMECEALVDRVVILNPATSFDQSVWLEAGELLTRIPQAAYNFLPLALSPILGNPVAMAGRFVNDDGPPGPQQLTQLGEALLKMLPQIVSVKEVLPADTLLWKLELLREGCDFVNPRAGKVNQRVLGLFSDNDLLIPSKAEEERLMTKLPRGRAVTLEGRAHAALLEAGVDLFSIICEQGFYATSRMLTPGGSRGPAGQRVRAVFGEIGPVSMPTEIEIDHGAERNRNLERLVSPVFFSTFEDGRVVQGFGAIPDPDTLPGPIIFVGNHQSFGLDMNFMIERFLREKKMLVRGMAHPAIFAGLTQNGAESDGSANRGSSSSRSGNGGNGGGGAGGIMTFFQTWGAVKITPRNVFKMLSLGEHILIYPGGAREALKSDQEDYELFWPDRPEIIQLAARFNATIIPFGAVGNDETVGTLVDRRALARENIPFVSDRIRATVAGLPNARGGVTADDQYNDEFVAPLPRPKPPRRFYYKFGAPITYGSEELTYERRLELYRELEAAVKGNIDYVLAKRESDPYRDLQMRMLYEASWFGKKQAPTFKP